MSVKNPSLSVKNQIDCEPLKKLIRTVPDFPKPGILFYDITPCSRTRPASPSSSTRWRNTTSAKRSTSSSASRRVD